MDNAYVESLPKNTTPILQPLNLGIIASIKKRYKHLIAQRAVDLVDSGHYDSIYKVDIRLAGHWIYEIWEQLQNDLIFNCWVKSSLV